MYKFKLVPALFLLVLGLMVTPAQAQKNGFYLGLKFIDSIQTVWIEDFSETQNTVGGAAFVGFDFYPKFDAPVRVEIEYALRSDLKHTDEIVDVGDLEYKYNAQTLLANFYYDFHNSTNFTPYLGAGLGMAFTTETVDARDGAFSNSEKRYSTNFAWHVGAGVAYAFNEFISADLGYRYLSLGNSSSDIEDVSVPTFGSAHELSLGVRFNF